jgi:hypothetical protein
MRAFTSLLFVLMQFGLLELVFAHPFSSSFKELQRANSIGVIGWIPPYGIEKSLAALNSNPAIAKGLTRIGLQFWNPRADGKGIVFAPINAQAQLVLANDVRRIVAWAKKRNIEVVLTIYNNSQVIGKWDWALARRGFAENPKAFAAALIKEMKKYDLDGIDLDLEGEGELDQDRAAYRDFVRLLSSELKKSKKTLTVDSFHSPCVNAPNMSWWKDWVGQVDAIHSMGYEDLYEGSTETFSPNGKSPCEGGAAIFKYSWQLQYARNAGYLPSQIMMGVPTWLVTWGRGGLGSDVLSHLKEAQDLGVGIALWDLQLAAPKWRSTETWDAIFALKSVRSSPKQTSP